MPQIPQDAIQRSSDVDPGQPPSRAPAGLGGVTRLRVKAGALDLVLTGERALLLGRDPAADVRLDDHRVSRRHAVIRFDGERWRIEDLGSSNGTYLEGTRIGAHVVERPATIRLGSATDGPAVALEPLVAVPSAPPMAPPPPAGVEATVALPSAGSAIAAAGAPRSVDLGRRVAVPRSAPRWSGSAAPRCTTSCSPTPTSRGTTPSCGAAPPAVGRSSTSAATQRNLCQRPAGELGATR